MNGVIGELLPFAIGVAISPIPIIAVILMLLAPKAGATSLGFLIGWIAGIVVAVVAFSVIASTVGLDIHDGSSSTSWIKVGIGALLILLGFRQWRGRAQAGEAPVMPKWMAALDSFTFGKALGLGFVLAAINPKNLLLSAAGGVVVGSAGLDSGQNVIAVAVFTVIAASTVLIPCLAYAVAKEPMRKPLDELKSWLEVHNAAVMCVLLVVIGVVVLGNGVGRF